MTPNTRHQIPASGLGHQFIADIYDCDTDISDPEFVRKVALEAAEIGNATIIKEVTHEFSPHGLSCVLVISESHIALHTWPEHGYVAVDIFTCDLAVDGYKIIDYVKTQLKAERATTEHIRRGLPSPHSPID